MYYKSACIYFEETRSQGQRCLFGRTEEQYLLLDGLRLRLRHRADPLLHLKIIFALTLFLI